ncbi:MAG: hypothetical protein V4537_10380 [Pseudomonadota bacterium]
MANPVYIRHHGRTKLVLTSVDFMSKLMDARDTEVSDSFSIESLLDLIDTMVIVTDSRLCVVAMSPPARHHFANSDWHGHKLETLLPEQLRSIIMRSVHHVIGTGTADSFHLRLGEKAQNLVEVAVRPFDGGVCIIGHDRRATQARIETGAIFDAVRQTFNLLEIVAVVRINLRGFIVGASESFESMSGLTPDAYRSVRMPTLFDITSRITVSDALERAIDRVEPQHVEARLMVNRGDPVDVRIAVSAEMLRASLDYIVATIVRVG